jgi:regulator of replication initiation timing
MEAIKLRKLIREKEIIKQRYENNWEENVRMRSEIDSLQAQLDQMQSR